MKQIKYSQILKNIEENQYQKISSGEIPQQLGGWIKLLRWGFGVSLRQFGKRLGITPASANEMEQRETEGNITIEKLRQAANAFDMDLLYLFIPRAKYITSKNPLQE